MRYVALIYSDEVAEANMTPDEMGALMAGYGKFHEEFGPTGMIPDGARLRPTGSATSVRVRNGDTITTDGPFAETKEHLGGFYMIEAPDLDAAIAIAAKIPTAQTGTVELRPVWEMEDM